MAYGSERTFDKNNYIVIVILNYIIKKFIHLGLQLILQ